MTFSLWSPDEFIQQDQCINSPYWKQLANLNWEWHEILWWKVLNKVKNLLDYWLVDRDSVKITHKWLMVTNIDWVWYIVNGWLVLWEKVKWCVWLCCEWICVNWSVCRSQNNLESIKTHKWRK